MKVDSARARSDQVWEDAEMLMVWKENPKLMGDATDVLAGSNKEWRPQQ
jgi:hypothetical protein